MAHMMTDEDERKRYNKQITRMALRIRRFVFVRYFGGATVQDFLNACSHNIVYMLLTSRGVKEPADVLEKVIFDLRNNFNKMRDARDGHSGPRP